MYERERDKVLSRRRARNSNDYDNRRDKDNLVKEVKSLNQNISIDITSLIHSIM